MPGPKPTYSERLNLVVEPELREGLRRFAEQIHAKEAHVIRAALREYLAKHMESERAA